jgi:hypothetical protein
MNAPHPYWELVRAQLQGTRKPLLWLGVVFLVVAIACVALVLVAAEPGEELVPCVLISLLVGLPGALFAVAGARGIPPSHPLLVALGTSPENIQSVSLGYRATLFGYKAGVRVVLRSGARHLLSPPKGEEKALATWIGSHRAPKR